MRKPSPCNKCPERFTACSARCPKDERGDYGYKAWKADLDAENQEAKLRKSIDHINNRHRGKWMQTGR